MITIYKYRIEANYAVEIDMHINAEILDVQVQHGNVFLWAIVDTDAPYEKRLIEVYGTGHELKPISPVTDRKYLGTYQLEGGNLVFHVFELIYPFYS